MRSLAPPPGNPRRTLALALLLAAYGCEPVDGADIDAAAGLDAGVPDAAPAFAIMVQPADQTVTTGSTATFWVTATAPAVIAYQWTRDGEAIAGAKSAQYTTPRTTSEYAGASYAVTLSSGEEVLTSADATLTINTEIDDLMALATDFRWSRWTPMGKHYENLPVVTDEDRAYLAEPGNQPPVPPGLEASLAWQGFPVTLYPTGSPRPADVNQHDLGDCNGLSALASLAYQNPQFVQGLITNLGDGVFSVAMFDPQGQPITVTVDSQFLADARGDLVAASGKHGDADWATVLEKAIMKYNVVFPADTTIEAIGSENVTPLFTGAGNSFAFDRGVLTPDQITRVVEASLACGKLITGGFGEEIALGDVYSVVAHGYACFWPSNDDTMISMRNPWGANPLLAGGYDTRRDGLLDIPISTTWSHTIDLRVIDPGRAGSAGRTTPYAPLWSHTIMSNVRIADRHGHPGR